MACEKRSTTQKTILINRGKRPNPEAEVLGLEEVVNILALEDGGEIRTTLGIVSGLLAWMSMPFGSKNIVKANRGVESARDAKLARACNHIGRCHVRGSLFSQSNQGVRHASILKICTSQKCPDALDDD